MPHYTENYFSDFLLLVACKNKKTGNITVPYKKLISSQNRKLLNWILGFCAYWVHSAFGQTKKHHYDTLRQVTTHYDSLNTLADWANNEISLWHITTDHNPLIHSLIGETRKTSIRHITAHYETLRQITTHYNRLIECTRCLGKRGKPHYNTLRHTTAQWVHSVIGQKRRTSLRHITTHPN